MACTFTSWSSSKASTSSTPVMMCVSVFLYGTHVNRSGPHSAFIASSAVCSAYSFPATTLMSLMSDMCSMTPQFTSCCRDRNCLPLTAWPILVLICSQCRSCNAGDARHEMMGT